MLIAMLELAHLPLQIASGILIAALVMALFRWCVEKFRERDMQTAVPAGVLVALLGGGLILAGLGLAPY